MDYYSAKLLLICLIDDGKSRQRNVSQHLFAVFLAKNHKHAFKRALEWGRQQETRYGNMKGQPVRWALVEVQIIKFLGKTADGATIGFMLDPLKSDKPVPFRKRFHPERSKVRYE